MWWKRVRDTICCKHTRSSFLIIWSDCSECDSPLGLKIQFHWFFLKKWANPGLFYIYFRLFKHTLHFLQQIKVKKCPSRIQCRDSNSWPLEHESPPITTRPGFTVFFFFFLKWAIPGLFLFIFVFSIQMIINIRGPLILKATALPFEPQPLP